MTEPGSPAGHEPMTGGAPRVAAIAPLDDPTYVPTHPPINGQVPDVVAKWGPRSQLRWFRRFDGQLSKRRDWDRFYCNSEYHRGPCCYSCYDEYLAGIGVMMDGWCCCRQGLAEQMEAGGAARKAAMLDAEET